MPTDPKAAALEVAKRCRSAELRAEQVLAARHRASLVAVARALSVEVRVVELAEALGVTRQRVYQMRDEAANPAIVRPE
jgi:hypothetical protein